MCQSWAASTISRNRCALYDIGDQQRATITCFIDPFSVALQYIHWKTQSPASSGLEHPSRLLHLRSALTKPPPQARVERTNPPTLSQGHGWWKEYLLRGESFTTCNFSSYKGKSQTRYRSCSFAGKTFFLCVTVVINVPRTRPKHKPLYWPIFFTRGDIHEFRDHKSPRIYMELIFFTWSRFNMVNIQRGSSVQHPAR